MPTDEELLEHMAGTMRDALEHIAQREDCLYADFPDDPDRPKPCDCAPCTASRALQQTTRWKLRCSRSERLQFNPRERKLVDSFIKSVGDKELAHIIEGLVCNVPTLRDWYVTISVIRWLGTNCGSAVLNEAGWQYTQYDQDRIEREKRRETV